MPERRSGEEQKVVLAVMKRKCKWEKIKRSGTATGKGSE
jgi:hypothetical protein